MQEPALRLLRGRPEVWEAGPTPFLFLHLGLSCSAYPADESGIGERGPHVVELEVVHVVEELWGWGKNQTPSGSSLLPLPPASALRANVGLYRHSYCTENLRKFYHLLFALLPPKWGLFSMRFKSEVTCIPKGCSWLHGKTRMRPLILVKPTAQALWVVVDW